MSRIIMPLAEWPQTDRQLFEMAQWKGDFLEKSGPAANWSETTLKTRLKAYGVWLQFLENNGLLDPEIMPAARVNRSSVEAYFKELEGRNADITVAGRLRDLLVMITTLQPGTTLPYLQRLLKRVKRQARPSRNKHARMVHPATILQAVQPLLDRLVHDHEACGRKELAYLRNGLILVVLIVMPVRLKNIAKMRLGTNITRNNGHYDIFFNANETKNKRPYQGILPPILTPVIDSYLEHARPRLLGDTVTDALWASYRYGRVSKQSIYVGINEITTDLLGAPINPHLSRDIAATYYAVHHSANVRAAAAVLGHANLKTTQKHYNQAQMLDAVRQFQIGL